MIHRNKDNQIEGTVLTAIQKNHDELESRFEKRTAELEKLNEELSKEIEKRKKFEADLKLPLQRYLSSWWFYHLFFTMGDISSVISNLNPFDQFTDFIPVELLYGQQTPKV